MSSQRVFVARLAGCTVFDPAGDRLGKVRDVVVVYRKSDPPRVVGLVCEIPGRRQVFLSIGRVTSIAQGQVITTGLVNMRRFEQRANETLVMAELIERHVTVRGDDGPVEATVEDIGVGYRVSQPFPSGEINGTMTVQSIDELICADDALLHRHREERGGLPIARSPRCGAERGNGRVSSGDGVRHEPRNGCQAVVVDRRASRPAAQEPGLDIRQNSALGAAS